MNKKTINLNYHYHVEDKEYLDRRSYTERFKFINYIFLYTMLVIILSVFNTNPSLYNTFIYAVIFFIALFLFHLFSQHKIKQIIKNDPRYTNEINLQINEKWIEISQNNMKRIIPWNYIVKFKELKRTILIYYSPYKHIMIPKRIMKENELQLIKDIFNTSQ